MLTKGFLRLALAVLAVLATDRQLDAEPAVAEPGVELQLVEPGDAPRYKLRFTPEVGAKQSVVLSMRMNQAITINGATMPSPKMPVQKMTMEFEVTEVEPSGDIHFDYEYTKVEVVADAQTQAMAPMLEAQMKPMEGTTGSVVISDRGYNLKSELSVPEGVSPQIKQAMVGMQDSMDQMCSPLPEEAVGVGARWKLTQNVVANGIAMTQRSTYVVKEISEGHVALDVELKQEAEEQQINPPGVAPNVTLSLKSLNSEGTGKMTIDTQSMIPEQSKVSIESNVEMEIQSGDQAQPMGMEMQIDVSIRPGEQGADSP